MKKVLHVSLLLSIIILLIGCGGGSPKPSQTSQQAQIKKPANYETVQAAFKDSLNVYNSNSRWFQDKEVLELTIIGPVYKNPIEKQSSAYKKLATLLKKIAKDKTLLDKLSNFDISKRYSKINYIPYKLGSNEDATFTAVYEQRLDSKEKLRQTLQELDANGKDKIGQTLAIWINPQDLKNNTYTLEGYKSVKNSTKNRNSAYYHLSKGNSNGTDNQDIINAVLATLQLSIPEYVAIDRKDMLQDGENFRIVSDNPDGTATGKVYKFDIETEVDKLEQQKKQTTDQNKLQELDKQIQEVKASKQWREYETKQLLYTTPISQDTIYTLSKYAYLDKAYTFNKLTPAQGKEIGKALKYALPDSFLLTQFEQYKTNLNYMEINIGDIRKIGKANYIRGLANSTVENEARSASDLKNGLADVAEGTVVAAQVALQLLTRSSQGVFYNPNFNDELNLKYVNEPTPMTSFYGVSGRNIKDSGLLKVHEDKYNSFSHSVKTWKINDTVSTMEFSSDGKFIYWTDGSKLHIKDTKTLSDYLTIDVNDGKILKSFMSIKNSKILMVTDKEEFLAYDLSGVLIKKVKADVHTSGVRMNGSITLGDDFSRIVMSKGVLRKYLYETIIKTDNLQYKRKEIRENPWNNIPFQYFLSNDATILKSNLSNNINVFSPFSNRKSLIELDIENGSNEVIFQGTGAINLINNAGPDIIATIPAGRDSNLYIFDKDSHAKVLDITIPGINNIESGTCNRDIEYCFFQAKLGWNKRISPDVYKYHIKTKKLELLEDNPDQVAHMFFIDNKSALFIKDNKVYLRRLNDLEVIYTFSEHYGKILSLKYKDGLFLTQSMDGSVKLWDLAFLDIIDKEY